MDGAWTRDLWESQALFDAGKFFEAHERLEDAWRRETGERKLYAQGLTQVCAAFHKLKQKGRATDGVLELLEKGREKIAGTNDGLARQVEEAAAAVRAGRTPPPLRWA